MGANLMVAYRPRGLGNIAGRAMDFSNNSRYFPGRDRDSAVFSRIRKFPLCPPVLAGWQRQQLDKTEWEREWINGAPVLPFS